MLEVSLSNSEFIERMQKYVGPKLERIRSNCPDAAYIGLVEEGGAVYLGCEMPDGDVMVYPGAVYDEEAVEVHNCINEEVLMGNLGCSIEDLAAMLDGTYVEQRG